MIAKALAAGLWFATSAWLIGCGSSCSGCNPWAQPAVRVVRNPYASVDWSRTLRLKTALHEHVRDKPDYLARLDAAGYDAVPLMHYSGVASQAHFWHERHWPPERFLPKEFFDQLRHIKLFFPNAEEVGFDHVTSPFLTTYIAQWEPDQYAQREAWHYGSTQEAIDLIVKHGGLAFIAHPWDWPQNYLELHGYTGMELYNAYCRGKFQLGERLDDCNADLVRAWDHVLRQRPATVGIAVNDWFGAFRQPEVGRPELDCWDSGKTIVLAKAATLPALRAALATGAVLAVKDLGRPKDRFPQIREIVVGDRSIRIGVASGSKVKLRWIANGKVVASDGPVLELAKLDKKARYVRAEITDANGSTVYTQAFALAPRGR